MSKIFESENQFIMRFPKDVAETITRKMDENKEDELNIDITPYFENFRNQYEELKFNVNVNEKSLKGSLVNLPNIVESQKTLDGINFFKSNDITQLILLEEDSSKLSQKIQQQRVNSSLNQQIKTKKIKKNEIPSGLTAPTKWVQQRYFRRKLNLVQEEVVKIEERLAGIIQDFTKQREQSQSEIKRKRRYRRHL